MIKINSPSNYWWNIMVYCYFTVVSFFSTQYQEVQDLEVHEVRDATGFRNIWKTTQIKSKIITSRFHHPSTKITSISKGFFLCWCQSTRLKEVFADKFKTNLITKDLINQKQSLAYKFYFNSTTLTCFNVVFLLSNTKCRQQVAFTVVIVMSHWASEPPASQKWICLIRTVPRFWRSRSIFLVLLISPANFMPLRHFMFAWRKRNWKTWKMRTKRWDASISPKYTNSESKIVVSHFNQK